MPPTSALDARWLIPPACRAARAISAASVAEEGSAALAVEAGWVAGWVASWVWPVRSSTRSVVWWGPLTDGLAGPSGPDDLLGADNPLGDDLDADDPVADAADTDDGDPDDTDDDSAETPDEDAEPQETGTGTDTGEGAQDSVPEPEGTIPPAAPNGAEPPSGQAGAAAPVDKPAAAPAPAEPTAPAPQEEGSTRVKSLPTLYRRQGSDTSARQQLP